MLTSIRRLTNGPKQDDMLYDAGERADEAFDQPSYDLPTPTFFPDAFREMPVGRLADRYRSVREVSPPQPVVSRRPGQSRALQPYPVRAGRYTPDLEEMFAPSEIPARRPTQAPSQTRATIRADRPRQSGMFLVAGIAAVVVGGGLGYTTTKLSHRDITFASVAAAAQPPASASIVAMTAAQPLAAAIGRKTIAMTRLDVADVSGGLNSMIPLALHAEAPNGGRDIILKLSGLPKSAYLTAGARVNDGDWQLTSADASNVKLVVPRADAPRFNVAVTAVESKTGEMAAPPKEMTVAITGDAGVEMVPASAAPSTAKVSAPAANSEGATAIPAPSQQLASTAPAPRTEAENLVSKGDILLKSGDLAMARQFYERAYAEGAKASAALGAARTFDPIIYAQLKVQGLQPDPQQAMDWYERAKAEGNVQAAAAIDALKNTAP